LQDNRRVQTSCDIVFLLDNRCVKNGSGAIFRKKAN